jgi:hypothetical protein
VAGETATGKGLDQGMMRVDAVIRDDWDDADRVEVRRSADGRPLSVSISGVLWDRACQQGQTLQAVIEDILRKSDDLKG